MPKQITAIVWTGLKYGADVNSIAKKLASKAEVERVCIVAGGLFILLIGADTESLDRFILTEIYALPETHDYRAYLPQVVLGQAVLARSDAQGSDLKMFKSQLK